MAWYLYGDGLKLWEEASRRSALVPRPRPLEGRADDGMVPQEDQRHPDYKGLKMRIPASAAVVPAAAAVHPHAGRQDLHALDAAPSTPAGGSVRTTNMKLGLHNAARYYYYAGWRDRGPTARLQRSTRRRSTRCRPTSRRSSITPPAVQVISFQEHGTRLGRVPELKAEFKDKVELVSFRRHAEGSQEARQQVIKEGRRRRPRAKKASPRSTSRVPGRRLTADLEAAYQAHVAGS